MTPTTLDDRLRDLATRGELVHLSITPDSNGVWSAAYTPASVFGIGHGIGADPVAAALAALDNVKLKRRVSARPTPEPETSVEEAYDPAA